MTKYVKHFLNYYCYVKLFTYFAAITKNVVTFVKLYNLYKLLLISLCFENVLCILQITKTMFFFLKELLCKKKQLFLYLVLRQSKIIEAEH